MQVAITGVAGFIGSNLAQSLMADGHQLRGIDDLSTGLREQVPEGVEFVRGDILTADLDNVFRGADAVFHMAAHTSVIGCQDDVERATDVNCSGTARVLEAVLRCGVRKVIAAETSAVYEGTAIYPTPETVDAPRSIYAITKRCSGLLVHAYAADHRMAATTLRYFNVYGPNQDYRRRFAPVIPSFAMALLSGKEPVIYGDGKKSRDFIYISDVNRFHLLALHSEAVNGEVYNLGTGHSTSVASVLEKVQAHLGKRTSPKHVAPKSMEAEFTQADIAKACSLGWAPEVTLDQGIESTIAHLAPLAGRHEVADESSTQLSQT